MTHTPITSQLIDGGKAETVMTDQCREKQSELGDQAEKTVAGREKWLPLKRSQCSPFTDIPSYTLSMGNCILKGGGLSVSLACSWGLVTRESKGSHGLGVT